MSRNALGRWTKVADTGFLAGGNLPRVWPHTLYERVWIGPSASLVAYAPPPSVNTPSLRLSETRTVRLGAIADETLPFYGNSPSSFAPIADGFTVGRGSEGTEPQPHRS